MVTSIGGIIVDGGNFDWTKNQKDNLYLINQNQVIGVGFR